MRDRRDDSTGERRLGHDEAWELLPWLVNGTLDAAERHSVETHVAGCTECRAEVEHCRGLADQVRSASVSPSPHPGPAASAAGRRRRSRGTGRPWPQPFAGHPRFVRGALLAQAAVILVLLALAFWPAVTTREPSYRTLSDVTTVAAPTQQEYRIIFRRRHRGRSPLAAPGCAARSPAARRRSAPTPSRCRRAAPVPSRCRRFYAHLRANPRVRLAEPVAGTAAASGQAPARSRCAARLLASCSRRAPPWPSAAQARARGRARAADAAAPPPYNRGIATLDLDADDVPRPLHGPRTVRAPRGTEISCRGWQQEAALRMLMNNLDPEVAERPEDLVVYGGSGKAARNWECFEAIVATLRRLGDDETLLVQSGKPVAVFKTHAEAPRVLIANSMLVPHWATADEFRRLEGLGPHHVRPDDRRLVDLHRHPGHPPGHLRDARRVRPPALRRLARRPAHRHRRPRRHGRRAAARGHHERGGLPGGRGRPLAHRAPARHPLSRRGGAGHPDRRRLAQALAARDRREAVSIAVEANAVDLLEHLLAAASCPTC